MSAELASSELTGEFDRCTIKHPEDLAHPRATFENSACCPGDGMIDGLRSVLRRHGIQAMHEDEGQGGARKALESLTESALAEQGGTEDEVAEAGTGAEARGN